MTDDKLIADLRIPKVREIFQEAGREYIDKWKTEFAKRCREDGVDKSRRVPDREPTGNRPTEQGAA
jgi:hypothetical protein